jgi:hypothetical protein
LAPSSLTNYIPYWSHVSRPRIHHLDFHDFFLWLGFHLYSITWF